MNQVIEQFAAECHDILSKDSGPAGIEQVRKNLEKVLVNKDVTDEYLGPDADSPRNILYEDSELGFCIIAHVFKGARIRDPHDHGPSWAIYGQVEGTTKMTEFKLLEAPADGKPGKVEAEKSYDLEPGMAVAYNIGVLHAPVRDATTKLIRIEGRNMAGVKRDKFELAA